MLTTTSWILIILGLLIIAVFVRANEDAKKYAGYKCHEEDFHACAECSSHQCEHYKMAQKAIQLENTIKKKEEKCND